MSVRVMPAEDEEEVWVGRVGEEDKGLRADNLSEM